MSRNSTLVISDKEITSWNELNVETDKIEVIFEDITISNVTAKNTCIYNYTIDGVIKRSTFKDAAFIQCDFSDAEIRSSTFTNVEFKNCVFKQTTTTDVTFDQCTFPDSILPSGRFTAYRPLSRYTENNHYAIVKVTVPAEAERCSRLISRLCSVEKISKEKVWVYDSNLTLIDEEIPISKNNMRSVQWFDENRLKRNPSKNGFGIYLTKEEAISHIARLVS